MTEVAAAVAELAIADTNSTPTEFNYRLQHVFDTPVHDIASAYDIKTKKIFTLTKDGTVRVQPFGGSAHIVTLKGVVREPGEKNERIFVDKQSNLWISTSTCRGLRFTQEGELLHIFASTHTFRYPVFFANGNFAVTVKDMIVQFYDNNGALLNSVHINKYFETSNVTAVAASAGDECLILNTNGRLVATNEGEVLKQKTYDPPLTHLFSLVENVDAGCCGVSHDNYPGIWADDMKNAILVIYCTGKPMVKHFVPIRATGHINQYWFQDEKHIVVDQRQGARISLYEQI
jgi:hypothetical protein